MTALASRDATIAQLQRDILQHGVERAEWERERDETKQRVERREKEVTEQQKQWEQVSKCACAGRWMDGHETRRINVLNWLHYA